MKTLQLFITYEGINFDNCLSNPVGQAEIIKISERLAGFAEKVLKSKTGFIDIKSDGSLEIEGFEDDLQESIIDYLKTSNSTNHHKKS